jgi:hypothetical protein
MSLRVMSCVARDAAPPGGSLSRSSYDGLAPGSRIADMFYSFHSWRDGAQTQVTRHRSGCFRKATKPEIYGHGRWRLAWSSEPINDQFTQPPIWINWLLRYTVSKSSLYDCVVLFCVPFHSPLFFFFLFFFFFFFFFLFFTSFGSLTRRQGAVPV